MPGLLRRLGLLLARAEPPAETVLSPLTREPTAIAIAVDELAAEPVAIDMEARIAMATRARDCDDLPKVPQAGAVVPTAAGERVQVMHNGIRVLVDGYCGAWMTDLIGRCQGHHEPQEERAFAAVLERLPADARMLELGGWWSFYTLWFLQSRPQRRSWVLEPDPAHRRVGEANMRLNDARATFIEGLIGSTAAPSALFQTEDGDDIMVPRRAVPELLAELGLDSLDLLHCDVQGAECDVLTSCAPLLREGRIRTVVVSTHHWRISQDPLTHQRCLATIIACGGQVLAEHDVQESFSGDGLIVARFGGDAADWPPIPLSRNRASTSLFRDPLYDLAECRDRR